MDCPTSAASCLKRSSTPISCVFAVSMVVPVFGINVTETLSTQHLRTPTTNPSIHVHVCTHLDDGGAQHPLHLRRDAGPRGRLRGRGGEGGRVGEGHAPVGAGVLLLRLCIIDSIARGGGTVGDGVISGACLVGKSIHPAPPRPGRSIDLSNPPGPSTTATNTHLDIDVLLHLRIQPRLLRRPLAPGLRLLQARHPPSPVVVRRRLTPRSATHSVAAATSTTGCYHHRRGQPYGARSPCPPPVLLWVERSIWLGGLY